MARINLLPWRERQRQRLKREFLRALVALGMVAAALLLLADRLLNRELGRQTARNDYIRAEIVTLDTYNAEIGRLQQTQDGIRERMNVIAGLQGMGPAAVRIFDELVRTLPNGVLYHTLERRGETIAIEGVAESWSRITELVRRLDESVAFADAGLSDISASQPDGAGRAAFVFSLTLKLEPPRSMEGA